MTFTAFTNAINGPAPQVRLLSKAKAAAYVGQSASRFRGYCPVPPVNIGTEDSPQLRWDVRALDAWIDALGRCADPSLLPQQGWLGLVEKSHVSRSR